MTRAHTLAWTRLTPQTSPPIAPTSPLAWRLPACPTLLFRHLAEGLQFFVIPVQGLLRDVLNGFRPTGPRPRRRRADHQCLVAHRYADFLAQATGLQQPLGQPQSEPIAHLLNPSKHGPKVAETQSSANQSSQYPQPTQPQSAPPCFAAFATFACGSCLSEHRCTQIR